MLDRVKHTKMLMENFKKFITEGESDGELTKYYNMILTELNKITGSKVSYRNDSPQGKIYTDASTKFAYVIDLKVNDSNLGEYVKEFVWERTFGNEEIDNISPALSRIPYKELTVNIQVIKDGRADYLHTRDQNRVDKIPARIKDMFHQENNTTAMPIILKIENAFEELSTNKFAKYIKNFGMVKKVNLNNLKD